MMKILQGRYGSKGLALLSFAMVTMVALSACQTRQPPRMADAPTSKDLCPICNQETHAAVVDDVEYTRCVCPECGKVTTLAPDGAETLRHYMGVGRGSSVVVCDRCESVVSVCTVCKETM